MNRFSTRRARGAIAVALTAALTASTPVARADVICLKDGQRFEGRGLRKLSDVGWVLDCKDGVTRTFLSEEVDRYWRERLEGFTAPPGPLACTTSAPPLPAQVRAAATAKPAAAPVKPAAVSRNAPLTAEARAAARASAARRVEELRAGLYSADERTREAALKELSAVPSSAPALVELASRPGLTPEMQRRLLEIVEAEPSPDILPELERLLEDPSTPPALLAHGAALAGRLDDEARRLRGILLAIARSGAEPFVRVAAVHALGARGARKEPEIARELVRDLATAPPDVRRALVDALAGMPHLEPDVLQTIELMATGSRDDGARGAAIELVAAAAPGASLLVAAARTDASPTVRARAIAGLAGSADALELFLESLKDKETCVVAAAARALQRRADARAIRPLIEALRGSSGGATGEIQSALEALTGAPHVPPTSVAWSIWWEEHGKMDPRFSGGGR